MAQPLAAFGDAIPGPMDQMVGLDSSSEDEATDVLAAKHPPDPTALGVTWTAASLRTVALDPGGSAGDKDTTPNAEEDTSSAQAGSNGDKHTTLNAEEDTSSAQAATYEATDVERNVKCGATHEVEDVKEEVKATHSAPAVSPSGVSFNTRRWRVPGKWIRGTRKMPVTLSFADSDSDSDTFSCDSWERHAVYGEAAEHVPLFSSEDHFSATRHVAEWICFSKKRSAQVPLKPT